jgi:DNA repair protein RadC
MEEQVVAECVLGARAKNTTEAAVALMDVIGLQKRVKEHMVVLAVDCKMQIIGYTEVSIGTIQSTLASPAEIYKFALLSNAAGIIIGHNHPSGDTTPSREDIDSAGKIAQAGSLLGIQLLDSIIVGRGTYTSMKEEGYIE